MRGDPEPRRRSGCARLGCRVPSSPPHLTSHRTRRVGGLAARGRPRDGRHAARAPRPSATAISTCSGRPGPLAPRPLGGDLRRTSVRSSWSPAATARNPAPGPCFLPRAT
ncbi:hypothetical protein HBB16_16880 [Pseudonocardia sp. MCCB 268]|nr:hypothetical protein [Pseudonocardia cytotoxica]